MSDGNTGKEDLQGIILDHVKTIERLNNQIGEVLLIASGTDCEESMKKIYKILMGDWEGPYPSHVSVLKGDVICFG